MLHAVVVFGFVRSSLRFHVPVKLKANWASTAFTQLAVVGHFRPIHQQEQLKAAETMWLSMEMWDDLAKQYYANIKKGRPVRGVGYVIQNKWTDKDTGEERKMYKVRITKMMAAEEFDKVSELLEDVDD
eukprot:gene22954-25999_t